MKTIHFALLTIFLATTMGCTEKIAGEPSKVVTRYVDAVKRGDYDTIFQLSHNSARRLKFFGMSELAQDKKIAQEYLEEQRKEYDAAPLDFTPGVQWAERHFFPDTCEVSIGKARYPAGTPGDPVNADYEQGIKVIVTVSVDYLDPKSAPSYRGKKLVSAKYDCFLSKIREGKNVRIYSHDDKWYVNGFLIDPATVRFTQGDQ